ncbi:coiled-coil domain-containing protein 152-like [Ylistrum balloti]|uniref:coiled-coil domain-containing protein 152-like n=1 Tax=Ylistrum balloti TaxID=509963 RepID=UPI002905B278|nr:coiled-coil domain-containing protein 152-like [Ylistrum balloti]
MDEGEKDPPKNPNEKGLDLDSIIDTYDNWQLVIADLMKKKTELSEETKNVRRDTERLERKNTELERTVADLQGMIDTLHKQLHTVCDLEENIRKGKEEIKRKTNELCDAKSEANAQKINHAKLIEKIQAEHSQERNELTETFNKEKNMEIDKLREIIEQKNDEIYRMQQKVDKINGEKESEILRISMDYESKLSKLKQKTIPPTQSNSSNQEIFRKKLLHLKTEYDREVNHLKYTISDLQEKLASQANTSRMSSSGKKRKN